MVKILPFQTTRQLIAQGDEFFDRVADAVSVLARAFQQYLDRGPDESLDERALQIRTIEARADELRRGVANVLYSQMLMPDTRGDVLSLLASVDRVLDDCVHLVVGISIQHPELDAQWTELVRSMVDDVVKAAQALVQGARAYFKDPSAVRDHVGRVAFHEKEATNTMLKIGVQLRDSALPRERKRELLDWLARVRQLASQASDVGDELAILAVKRAL